jgi:hypothetical protein
MHVAPWFAAGLHALETLEFPLWVWLRRMDMSPVLASGLTVLRRILDASIDALGLDKTSHPRHALAQLVRHDAACAAWVERLGARE